MSSDHLRKLVEQIKKEAQDPGGRSRGDRKPANPPPSPPADKGTTPASAPATQSGVPQRGNQKAPTNSGGAVQNMDIRKMQIAMQDLARTISSTINYDSLMKSLNQPQTADKKQFEKSYGRDAFSNFMVNRYLRNSKVKGEEFDTNPDKKKMPDKNPSDLKSMFVDLDTLQRIGKSNSEFVADGTWGPRTNNALRNISAIADAVMKLGSDLGMSAKSFDASKLSAFNPLIPEDDKEIDAQEKQKRAAQILPLLKGIKSLFLEFKEEVLSNPNYGAFINENEPLFSVGPKKEKGLELGGGEKTIYEDLQKNKNNSRFVRDTQGALVPVASVTLPPQYTGNKQVPPFQITGADLLDQNAFNNWVNSNSVLMNLQKSNPDTWNNVIKLILNQTKQQIMAKMSGPAPQQTSQKA